MARFFLGMRENGDIGIRAGMVGEVHEDGTAQPIRGTFRGVVPKGRSALGLSYEELVRLAEGPGYVETNDDGSVK